MKLVVTKQPAATLGLVLDSVVEGNEHREPVVWLLESSDGWPTDLIALIERWDQFESRLQQLVTVLGDGQENPSIPRLSYSECRLEAPIQKCEKLICIGKNYADHAKEMGGSAPEIPVVFSKFASAIIGPEEDVVLPSISDQVDFEAELVVVIGKPGRQIPREKALSHVFGYCCGNDISARDWQKGKPGGQWLVGKTFDTFAPLGPMVVTADEITDPANLTIQMRLNGQVMQSASTQDLIFPVGFLISHLSKFVTLKPGDLIFTGTPAGVGAGRTPQVFLQSGDRLEVEIEDLGVLVNGVRLAAS